MVYRPIDNLPPLLSLFLVIPPPNERRTIEGRKMEGNFLINTINQIATNLKHFSRFSGFLGEESGEKGEEEEGEKKNPTNQPTGEEQVRDKLLADRYGIKKWPPLHRLITKVRSLVGNNRAVDFISIRERR